MIVPLFKIEMSYVALAGLAAMVFDRVTPVISVQNDIVPFNVIET